jgi:hypothetical protein
VTENADPRIALLTAQDRRLLMVGQGTIGMVLAAAEAIGLIPKATAVTEYGIATTTDLSTVVLLDSLDGADSYLRQVREADPAHDHRLVSCIHTTYEDTFTEWTPVPTPEETHA